ncbi:MAG: hypothetical protein JNJ57_21595, partial [Saprospiraceae bacterium]|nr:hypothetical protein [Saprospiraceae bacterium]
MTNKHLLKSLFIASVLLSLGNATVFGQCALTATITSDPPTPARLCPGQLVTIAAESSGGTGPYQYLWGDGNTNQSFTVAVPFVGSYFLTITDSEGCTATTSLHIKGYTFFFLINELNADCSGVQLGTSYPHFPDGTSFLWSTGETTPSILAPTSGTYSLTVTDPTNTCTSSNSITVFVPDNGTPPTLSGPGVFCSGGNNTLEVLNAGDYASFLWSNGSTSSTTVVNGPGLYSVTVTNLGGCTSEGSVDVAANLTLNAFVTPSSSCTTPNGFVDLVVEPFSFNYTYLWSNGETTEDISDLQAGSYTVTVTASSSCTASSTFVVNSDVQLPSATTSTTASTCEQDNGAIDLTVTPPDAYEFLWSNGSTAEDITDLAPGTYAVTVTAVLSGCTTTATGVVQNNNINISVTGNTQSNNSCLAPNGAINITPSPSGNFTFLWSNGETTEDLTGLNGGAYTVTVSAGGQCTALANFTLVDNTVVPDPNAIATTDTCEQGVGAIDLEVNPPGTYVYQWSSGQSSEDLVNISSATYLVTVTDLASGCSAVQMAVVGNFNVTVDIAGNTQPLYSCASPDGAIDVMVSPPGNYSYLWSTGATTEDLTDLDAGLYAVTVSFGSVCSNVSSFVIDDQTLVPQISGTSQDETCGNANGSIDLSVQPVGNYTFLWSDNSNTEDITNLVASIYSVTVTGANGCSSALSLTVNEIGSTFSLSASILPNTSCVTPNGAIDISVSIPGTYTFLWSNGANTEDLSGLAAGAYTVTATDAQGCTSTQSATVTDNTTPFSLSAATVPNTSCVAPNGAVDISTSVSG